MNRPLIPSPALATREEWLMAMTEQLRETFKLAGGDLPAKIRISCGWPSTRALSSRGSRVVGQCWSPTASGDGTTEIFISPALADPQGAGGVGAVLVHELVHACLPGGGHGAKFRRLAKAIGLEGKMTATKAGPALMEWLAALATLIGPYPHATLDMSKRQKQTTRLLKVICPNTGCSFLDDGDGSAKAPRPYSVRMSLAVYLAGEPYCGVCQAVMSVEEPLDFQDGSGGGG